MASQMIPDVPDTMFVLTNDTKVNGAAVILNDDTRQNLKRWSISLKPQRLK